MINFFRKTRKKMADDNRPLKYARYAIGEIVLVVVGILIALYLNDLKDQKNKNSLKEYYAQAIKTDLTRDQILINKIIDSVQSQRALMDVQISRIYSKTATIDTLIKIARHEFQPLTVTITFNDNSMTSLISTGNLNLFETDFSELLLDLHTNRKEASERNDELKQMFIERLNVYQLKYSRPYKDLPNDNLIDNILWQDIDEKDFAGNFRGILFMKKFMDIALLKDLKIIEGKITFLNDYIKSNYKNLE